MAKQYSWKIYLVFYLLAGSLLLIMVVLCLEAYCRWSKQYPTEWLSYDHETIWRLKPDQSIYRNGRLFARINQHGLRGKEFSKKKEKGVTRIMVLGDSYTVGLDYAEEQIFTSILDSLLKQHPANTRYEVMNVSVPAWATDQQYIYFLREGIHYQPDYLVVVVAGNDIRETYCKKIFQTDTDEKISYHPVHFPWKGKFYWWLSNHSSLFQYIQKKKWYTSYGNFYEIWRYYPVNFGVADSANWDAPCLLRHPIKEMEKGKRIFKYLAHRMNNLCKKNNCTMILTLIPSKWEFDGTYKNDSTYRLEAINDFTGKAAAEENIPYLDLYERLRAMPEPVSIFQSWEFHLNEKGHEFAGKEIYRFLKENVELKNTAFSE